jgi:hypothetical protein
VLEDLEHDVAHRLHEALQLVLTLLHLDLPLHFAVLLFEGLLQVLHEELGDEVGVAFFRQVHIPHVLQLALRGEDLLVEVELHEYGLGRGEGRLHLQRLRLPQQAYEGRIALSQFHAAQKVQQFFEVLHLPQVRALVVDIKEDHGDAENHDEELVEGQFRVIDG